MWGSDNSDDDDDKRVIDDDKRRKGASMNPLKVNYGIDIGLPRPLMDIVRFIVWVYLMSIRFLIYFALGLGMFMVSYASILGGSCYNSAPVLQCLVSRSNTAGIILPSFALAIGLVALGLYIDYRMEWRKYF